ncbi:unnamed protein product [Cunninghamella echinulata]
MATLRQLSTIVGSKQRPSISITSVSRVMLKKSNRLTPATLLKPTTTLPIFQPFQQQQQQQQCYSSSSPTSKNSVLQQQQEVEEATILLSTYHDKDAVYLKWNADYPVNQDMFSNNNKDSTTSAYSHVWLRDNCPCDQCIHPSSRQKLHSTADIDTNIEPKTVSYDSTLDQLVIEWNLPLRHQQQQDNNTSSSSSSSYHTSYYPLSYLRRYASQKTSQEFRFEQLKPKTWTRDQYQLNWVHYDDYMTTDKGLHQVVEQLYNDGLVFLKGVPLLDESVTKVAERIGPVQETFYGRDFDVKNVAKSVNIAYTSLYLGFHMDLMYLDCPPGIQLLHSLKNSVKGGSSIFLDSYKAVELLKEQYPEDYQVLVDTPVTFHYINNGHHMYYRRPTIVPNDSYTSSSSNEPSTSTWGMHVNYAPQFQGPMDYLSPKEMKRFYQAYQRFADFVETESLRYQITLQPGQLGK